jgi:hypothetical protein
MASQNMELSEDQKIKNYEFLSQTIYEMEHNLIDDYWFSDHVDRVALYRACFPNLAKTNMEIQDEKFRAVAENAEHVLDKLMIDIERTTSIEFDNYLELNQCLKYLCEYTMEHEDDFSDMFSKMTVSSKEETSMEVE